MKSNGEPLKKVVWKEDGWILREVPPSFHRTVAAFHRHESKFTVTGEREAMLNTIVWPGWVCKMCNRTAPEGMQALFYMMNWENV